MEKITKKHVLIVWFIMVALAMVCLILLQYYAFTEYNRIRAFKSSDLLITETEQIIAGNDEDRDSLHAFLKKSGLEKAEAAAYILDTQPQIPEDPGFYKDLARVLGVDQIHLFDENGAIFQGSNPEYFGLTMASGDQISFFQPMLKDKNLSLSQDMTPNTAEGKIMLYSMCWNREKTFMVQVGSSGERFPRILNRNRIDMFMDLIPDDHSRDIILTDAEDDVVVASTTAGFIEKKLSDLGIFMDPLVDEEKVQFTTGFQGNPIYCSAKNHKDYRIVIAQYKNQVNENISMTLFTFTEYLILVFIAMTFAVDHYYDRFMQEKAYAMRDRLTGLYNRRAYETTLGELEGRPPREDLVFVAMDVNGLKVINDSSGHQAGDILLKGAADCMTRCFEGFGTVYRFGGDEFAAVLFAKESEIQPLQACLRELCRQWSNENNMELSISIGFSISAAEPQASIRNLEALADQRMYEDKSRYYSDKTHNRRGASHEDQ